MGIESKHLYTAVLRGSRAVWWCGAVIGGTSGRLGGSTGRVLTVLGEPAELPGMEPAPVPTCAGVGDSSTSFTPQPQGLSHIWRKSLFFGTEGVRRLAQLLRHFLRAWQYFLLQHWTCTRFAWGYNEDFLFSLL